jgi:hypothetical protein
MMSGRRWIVAATPSTSGPRYSRTSRGTVSYPTPVLQGRGVAIHNPLKTTNCRGGSTTISPASLHRSQNRGNRPHSPRFSKSCSTAHRHFPTFHESVFGVSTNFPALNGRVVTEKALVITVMNLHVP